MTEKLLNKISFFTALAICAYAIVATQLYFREAKGKTPVQYTDAQFIQANFGNLLVKHDHENVLHSEKLKLVDSLTFPKAHANLDSATYHNLIAALKDIHLQSYYENVEESQELVQLLVAFLVLALLVIFYDPSHIGLPIVNITIPNTLVHLMVSIGMVYLWIQFGLAMNASLDDRLALRYLIKYSEVVEDFHVSYAYSELNSVADKGLYDVWCHWYYNTFDSRNHDEVHRLLAFFGLYIVYGVFWTLIHAACLILISILYRKKSEVGGAGLVVVLYFCCLILLVLASAAFISEFEHAGNLLATVWGLVAVCIWLWMKWGNRVKRVRGQGTGLE